MNIRLFYFLLLFSFSFLPQTLNAQFTCDSTRYLIEVFDSVETHIDVPFGSNGQALLMDVYEPKGDSLTQRPLLILAFGGSFVFGSRGDDYMKELGNGFAKKGYVVASIDYRLTPSLLTNPSNANFYGAVVKAMHDMKASVRYFKKEAVLNNNPFKIDTSLIYAGGVSAGAIAGIHAAYLSDVSEFPSVLDTTGIGGVEGLSGNPGYSSQFAGVFNLCGAIGDSSWIDAGEPRMLSMHGDNDVIIPYGSGNVVIFNANVPVDGSASMHVKLKNESIEDTLYTFAGAGHTPFLTGFSTRPGAYMDTVMNFTSGVLYSWLCEYYTWPTPIDPLFAEQLNLTVYPNPAIDQIRVEWEKSVLSNARLFLYDIQGQQQNIEYIPTSSGYIIDRKALAPGYYVVGLADEKTGRRYFRNVLLR